LVAGVPPSALNSVDGLPAFVLGLTTGLLIGYGVATIIYMRRFLAHLNQLNDRLERAVVLLRLVE
jgi:hypothetical protein